MRTPLNRPDDDDHDPAEDVSVAAMHTNVPLSNFMVRLFAEELPMLDSESRVMVYEELKAYDGPTITSQEELPAKIRELMDL